MRYYELFERSYEPMSVGHIVDKTGETLNVITIKITHDDGSVQYEFKVQQPGAPRGVYMGSATKARKGNAMMHVGVHDEYQGRGIANALYDYVEKQLGIEIEPNWALTDDGEKFWAKRKAYKATGKY